MKKKQRKRKALTADDEIKLSPLQQAIWDVSEAIWKVPVVDSTYLFRWAGNYLCTYAHHPFVLKKLIKLFQKIEKKRPFTESLLRHQVRVAWCQLMDSQWKKPKSKRELPTYSELTSKVCEIAKLKPSENLSRSIRFIADDLQLPMKSWGRK